MPIMTGEKGSQMRPVDQTGLPRVVAIEHESAVYGEPMEGEFIPSPIVQEGKAARVANGGFCPHSEGSGRVAAVHGDWDRRGREKGIPEGHGRWMKIRRRAAGGGAVAT